MKIPAAVALLACALTAGSLRAAESPGTYTDAMRWYERAAEAGSASAQFLLGRMHEEGVAGRPRDPEKAAELYRKAAEQGHVLAQFSLAVLYQEGRGVAEDPAQAARWLEAAAEQGLREAQYNLGWLYDRGIGVAPDRETAERWYRAAAQQGMTRAMVNLALVLVAAGPEDRDAQVEAWTWLALAAARGETGVKRIADDIADKLTPAEKARAEAALAARRKDMPKK